MHLRSICCCPHVPYRYLSDRHHRTRVPTPDLGRNHEAVESYEEESPVTLGRAAPPAPGRCTPTGSLGRADADAEGPRHVRRRDARGRCRPRHRLHARRPEPGATSADGSSRSTWPASCMYVPVLPQGSRQTNGHVVDCNMWTVDVLPTIADVLDVEIPVGRRTALRASARLRPEGPTSFYLNTSTAIGHLPAGSVQEADSRSLWTAGARGRRSIAHLPGQVRRSDRPVADPGGCGPRPDSWAGPLAGPLAAGGGPHRGPIRPRSTSTSRVAATQRRAGARPRGSSTSPQRHRGGGRRSTGTRRDAATTVMDDGSFAVLVEPVPLPRRGANPVGVSASLTVDGSRQRGARAGRRLPGAYPAPGR